MLSLFTAYLLIVVYSEIIKIPEFLVFQNNYVQKDGTRKF